MNRSEAIQLIDLLAIIAFVVGLKRLSHPATARSGNTLAAAWRAPVALSGRTLPHALGWFVQTYNGETVVWQFGIGANASSSLVMTLPARGITLVLLANSDNLVKPATLAAGDISVSPFARLFFQVLVK